MRTFIRDIPWLAPRIALARVGSTMGTALFESVRGGRYSILVTHPTKIIRTFAALTREIAKLPRIKSGLPFAGGIAFLLPYELVHYFEPCVPRPREDLFALPEVFAGVYAAGVVWDHRAKKVVIAGFERLAVEELVDELEKCRTKNVERRTTNKCTAVPTSNISRAGYLAAIRQIQNEIAAGRTFQVNLSQRFTAHVGAINPLAIYHRLARVNPAPYAGYLDGGDFHILSSSPELLFRITPDRAIETRPIAGTRPRGATKILDRKFARELQTSVKEQAEHTMLVDLERNDLGRICVYDSVRVLRFAHIEKYARVQHLVSDVVGTLRRGATFADIVRALHPGGTITGCPKVETAKIISGIEGSTRGAYTGALGYASTTGESQANILIRTLTLKDGVLSFQTGGGIVADSRPAAEYDETLAKAAALFEVVVGD